MKLDFSLAGAVSIDMIPCTQKVFNDSPEKITGCNLLRLEIAYSKFGHLLKPHIYPKTKPTHSIIPLLNFSSYPMSAGISKQQLPSLLLVLDTRIMTTGAN